MPEEGGTNAGFQESLQPRNAMARIYLVMEEYSKIMRIRRRQYANRYEGSCRGEPNVASLRAVYGLSKIINIFELRLLTAEVRVLSGLRKKTKQGLWVCGRQQRRPHFIKGTDKNLI